MENDRPIEESPVDAITPWRPLGLTLIIIVLYMLAREVVQHQDWGTGPHAWDRYDTWMTLPRLAGFNACLAVMWFHGGARKWGWNARWSGRGVFLMAVSLAVFLFSYASDTRPHVYMDMQLLSGWVRSLPVALFEETCFRGLVFLSLRRRFGAISSALLSSLLFALFHWHAQPIDAWPRIFVFGVAACAALERGTGLFWMAFTHELVDSLWLHFQPTPGRPHPEFMGASIVLNFFLLIVALWWMRRRPPLRN